MDRHGDPPQDPLDTSGVLVTDVEVLDAEPDAGSRGSLARAARMPRALSGRGTASGSVLPAVHAAAVAAGGFVAGAAVVGLVHRHQRSSLALAGGRRAGRSLAGGSGRASSPAGELMQVVASRTFIVKVHTLGLPGADR